MWLGKGYIAAGFSFFFSSLLFRIDDEVARRRHLFSSFTLFLYDLPLLGLSFLTL